MSLQDLQCMAGFHDWAYDHTDNQVKKTCRNCPARKIESKTTQSK